MLDYFKEKTIYQYVLISIMSIELILLTIESSYLFIAVNLIHYGSYLIFILHLVLAYLYGNIIYLSTGSTNMMAKILLSEIIFVYRYISDNSFTLVRKHYLNFTSDNRFSEILSINTHGQEDVELGTVMAS